jgi:hypothetical protein
MKKLVEAGSKIVCQAGAGAAEKNRSAPQTD